MLKTLHNIHDNIQKRHALTFKLSANEITGKYNIISSP